MYLAWGTSSKTTTAKETDSLLINQYSISANRYVSSVTGWPSTWCIPLLFQGHFRKDLSMGFSVQPHFLPWGLADKYVVYQTINQFLLCTLGYKSRTRPIYKDKNLFKGGVGMGEDEIYLYGEPRSCSCLNLKL